MHDSAAQSGYHNTFNTFQAFPITGETDCRQGCKSLLSIGGENLQFYPNFALFSTLGGMNLDHDFFQVSKSSDQKKGLHLRWNTFFPNSSGDLRSDAHRSQIFGGDAQMKTILKLLGEIQSNYWGDICPTSLRVSAPLTAGF